MTLPLPEPTLVGITELDELALRIQRNFEALAMVYPVQPENLAVQSPGGPPTGPAGGDLAGSTYPNPSLAPGVVADAEVSATAAIAQTKIAGLVSDLSNKQPLNAQLTALAALTTTAFGRGLLELTTAAAARTYIAAASDSDARFPTSGQKDALAGTNGIPSSSNRYLTNSDPRNSDARTPTAHAVSHKSGGSDQLRLHELAVPTSDVPMNTRKLTGLQQGSAAGHSAEYSQMIAGDVAAQLGFTLKQSVYAASIAALPAHGRSGDVLTASANGYLAPSFGSLRFSWASGTAGTGNGQFDTPYDLALDSSGNILVLDRYNDRVQKFNSSGVYQSQFALGNPPGPTAAGIAVDSSNNVWVAGQHSESELRLYKYNSAGTFQSSHVLYSGFQPRAYSITVDSSNNVYATVGYHTGFAYNYTVRKFNSSGTYQSTFGSAGNGNGQFDSPGGIAVDGSGNIYVADSGNHRVQKFNSTGTYQSQFGTSGSGDGQFLVPSGIETDSGGSIWVADYYNSRIQKFNSAGTYQAKYGAGGNGNGQFYGPRGLAVTAGGDLVATDSVNNRIQRFTAFTLATDDTVLVRHEGGGTHIENNVYTVTNPGSPSTQWVLTLRPDGATGYIKAQNMVIAKVENAIQNRVFTLTTPDPITTWTTPLTWERFEPGGPPTPHASNHSPGSVDPIPELDEVAQRGVIGFHSLTSSFATTGTHTSYQNEGLTTNVAYLPNRRLKITLKVNPWASGGSNILNFKVVRGSTDIAFFQTYPVGIESEGWTAFVTTPSTGATETFKVMLCAIASNTAVTSYGDANYTRQLVIEDIGPA